MAPWSKDGHGVMRVVQFTTCFGRVPTRHGIKPEVPTVFSEWESRVVFVAHLSSSSQLQAFISRNWLDEDWAIGISFNTAHSPSTQPTRPMGLLRRYYLPNTRVIEMHAHVVRETGSSIKVDFSGWSNYFPVSISFSRGRKYTYIVQRDRPRRSFACGNAPMLGQMCALMEWMTE